MARHPKAQGRRRPGLQAARVPVAPSPRRRIVAKGNARSCDGAWRLKSRLRAFRRQTCLRRFLQPPFSYESWQDGDGSPRRRTWWRPQTPLAAILIARLRRMRLRSLFATIRRQRHHQPPTLALAAIRRLEDSATNLSADGRFALLYYLLVRTFLPLHYPRKQCCTRRAE